MKPVTGLRPNDDLDAWVSGVRKGSGGAWINLNWVTREKESFFAPNRRVDKIPTGISYIHLGLLSITSSLTALVAQFVLEDEEAGRLNFLVNTDRATSTVPQAGLSFRIYDALSQKCEAVDDFRAGIRSDSEEWLRSRFPGFFASRPNGSHPATELMVTEEQEPWEPEEDASRHRRWLDVLGLSGWFGHWEYERMKSLRMSEVGRINGPTRRRSRKHVIVIAGRRRDLFEKARSGQVDDQSDWYIVQRLHDILPPLIAQFAVSAMLSEMEEELASIRDLTDKALHGSSARSLDRLRTKLLRVGLDGRIVALEIKDLATNEREWRFYVPDFRYVEPEGNSELLADVMREGQQKQADRIVRTETSLGELLSTSANLSAAARNLKLQGWVLLLTLISVIAAVVAAWAAVKAIQGT